jgi:hypothetical protein
MLEYYIFKEVAIMLLFAYDCKDDKKEFTVDEEFDYLEVEVISGDEIISVWKNGGPGEPPTRVAYCDANWDRVTDIYDFSYFVPRADVDDWLKRKASDDLRW